MAHIERPGSGVMYWEPKEQRRSEKAPDFKGFLMLEMDYKAGEKLKIAAWVNKTKTGANLLALQEDNFLKKKEQEGRVTEDVEVEYKAPTKRDSFKKKSENPFDEDVPF